MSDHMVPGVTLQKKVIFVLWDAVLRHDQRSSPCVYITMIETGSERPSSCYQRNNSCVRHAHMSVMSSCVLEMKPLPSHCLQVDLPPSRREPQRTGHRCRPCRNHSHLRNRSRMNVVDDPHRSHACRHPPPARRTLIPQQSRLRGPSRPHSSDGSHRGRARQKLPSRPISDPQSTRPPG